METGVRRARDARLALGGLLVLSMAVTRDLLFIDGRREVEVAWALARIRGGRRPAKIVLLAGRPLALARAHGRPFFFDQGGRLSARFGLRATPALMTREGAKLRIAEIPLRDEFRRRAGAPGPPETRP